MQITEEIQTAISAAPSGRNGRLVLLESAETGLLEKVLADCRFHLATGGRIAVMRGTATATFDSLARLVGPGCIAAGVALVRLVYSDEFGVLGIREEYADEHHSTTRQGGECHE